MQSAFIFFGGLADIFLSVMLWFILDSEKSVTVILDGEKVYAVAEVIKQRLSTINEFCEENDELNEEETHIVRVRKISCLLT